MPNAALNGLALNPLIDHLSLDRLVAGSMERTGATIGATAGTAGARGTTGSGSALRSSTLA